MLNLHDHNVEGRLLRNLLLPLWNSQFEVCGIVLDDYTTYAIRNDHSSPEGNFEFDFHDLVVFGHLHTYEEALGVYHTHPSNDRSPSIQDIAGWPVGENVRYWIVTEDSVNEWRKNDDGVFLVYRAGPPLDSEIYRIAERL